MFLAIVLKKSGFARPVHLVPVYHARSRPVHREQGQRAFHVPVRRVARVCDQRGVPGDRTSGAQRRPEPRDLRGERGGLLHIPYLPRR